MSVSILTRSSDRMQPNVGSLLAIWTDTQR